MHYIILMVADSILSGSSPAHPSLLSVEVTDVNINIYKNKVQQYGYFDVKRLIKHSTHRSVYFHLRMFIKTYKFCQKIWLVEACAPHCHGDNMSEISILLKYLIEPTIWESILYKHSHLVKILSHFTLFEIIMQNFHSVD